MKTLSIHELNTLTNFNYARMAWDGNDTKTVKIDYDAEYQDFLVTTSEKNVRKNRISKLQAEITAWAEGQLKSFGYAGLTVTAFQLSFENEAFGIELAFGDAEPVLDDSQTNEEG